MNRQFKFRAWHKQFKVMHDFILTDIVSDIYGTPCLYIEANGITELKPLIEFEIMQYLGEDSKDCEGIEVCEGDIVKSENIKSYGKIGIIKYRYGIFSASHFGTYDGECIWSDLKIIGNIHQNPELLNGI